jgi:hypothetical protein
MEPYGSYFDHTRNSKTVSGSTKRIRAYIAQGVTRLHLCQMYILLSKDTGLMFELNCIYTVYIV